MNHNFKQLRFSKENIDKYKTKQCIVPWNTKNSNTTNMLKHARYIEGLTQGLFLIDEIDNALIGYISWENTIITSLEVIWKYRHKGFGKYLLDQAISAGCNQLSVNKKNIYAINFYLKYGFIIINKDSNLIMYFKK
ncbi:MAG: hypothetical protein [Wendovervirus sonii]|uniref:N-acetyltransferase domain-containing protein n=1 Tax=phage Lak_Megaphage_Sonny TaxID=3109229 RepID=A0ABZ0Z5M1_9CAUD|nr:MAG: hypothetical protein [phage Lak_Megaphage_Sonny]